MTRAKELLDAATPLPWTHAFLDESVGHEDTAIGDAALIVYAVNTLPAYEAAVGLLEKVMPFVDNLEARDAIREALRRLQEHNDG